MSNPTKKPLVTDVPTEKLILLAAHMKDESAAYKYVKNQV